MPVPAPSRQNLWLLQFAVFALVSATFTTIYITQPVLPVIEEEFGISPVQVSMTVSIVILGIVLSNLFFGSLSDRIPIQPIILAGGGCVSLAGFAAAFSHDFNLFLAARLVQGLFIPALTTSLAAWLAKTLPGERLAVVMGSYISATVLGGLGGRLLGGWIHPPFHWRNALISASVLVAVTTCIALLALPRVRQKAASRKGDGFVQLLARKELLLIFACGAAGLATFSPVFNFLPYRLAGAPFHFSTELITLVYLVYILGIFIGPIAGRLSGLYGGGNAMIAGTAIFACSLIVLALPATSAIVLGLLGVCAGFFTIHSVAVGLLNRKLDSGQGRANALYAMFYYLGGWFGITGAGFAFEHAGWNGVLLFGGCFLVIPLLTGVRERAGGTRH